MADLNKIIQIDADTSGAEAGVTGLTNDLNGLDTSTTKVTGSTKLQTDALNTNKQSVLENGGAMGLLNDLTGGYAMMLKDAVEASTLFTKGSVLASAAQKALAWATGGATIATNAFRIALIATGIGAIVILLVSLIAAFSDYSSAAETAAANQAEFNLELEGTSRLFDQLNEDLQFSTKLTLEQAKARGASEKELRDIQREGYEEAYDNISNEIEAKIKLLETNKADAEGAKKATEELNKLSKDRSDLFNNQLLLEQSYKTSDYNKKKAIDEKAASDAQALRDKGNADVKKDLAEISKITQDAANANAKIGMTAIQAELFEIDLKYKKQLDLLKKYGKDSTELEIQIEHEKEAAIAKDRKERFEKELEDQKNQREKDKEEADALQKEQTALLEEAIDIEAKRKADEQEEKEKRHARNLEITQQSKDALLGYTDLFLKTDKEMQYAAIASDTINQLLTDNKLSMWDKLSGGLKAASAVAGKATGEGKALAIASTTIDTIQSGVSAFKGMTSTIPGPVGIALGAVAAAGALASGYASVKKILAVKVPGATSGGADTTPPPAPPQFNIVGQSSQNQLATTIAGKQAQPQEAFVVSQNVTTQQALDRNVQNNATFI